MTQNVTILNGFKRNSYYNLQGLFLFRVQCWSHFIVPVHGREWGRGSIHATSYKVVIVYIVLSSLQHFI